MKHVDLSRATWRKSSRSAGQGQCVEVAFVEDVTAVRDSKNPGGGVLAFGDREFAAFLASVKAGRLA